MSRNADVYSIPSMRVALADGAVVKIGPFSGQLATTIKLLSGGTLEIGAYGVTSAFGATLGLVVLAGSASFQTAQVAGQMYPLSTNEAFSANVSGYVSLYASGGACVVAIASGKSAN